VLLAASRGARLDASPAALSELLTGLSVADGLRVSDQYRESSCVVMNPPYGRVVTEAHAWRKGSVSAAALFVERTVMHSAPGTQISALLPEVLRTGTSYQQWRNHIDQFVIRKSPESLGLFSKQADVDVYIQHFTTREARVSLEAAQSKPQSPIVGDHFNVTVGAVVPHRHAPVGRRFAYLRAQNAVPWGEIRRISETRFFSGRIYTPPFVVVRRTSRPGDPERAVASLGEPEE
jgi:hypothetical protein